LRFQIAEVFMNKRDIMFSLLDDGTPPPYVPAAFFLHFPAAFHEGQAAVDKHLEYFRYTGMDLVKIQYEKPFPPLADIQNPQDWRKMPAYGRDFFEGQLQVVEGLVKAAKHEAVVGVTLYSPYMSAAHTVGETRLTEHLQSDPEQVRQGMDVITESVLLFVRACIKLGVDGFYHSTQGGEAGRFADGSIFERYIKPYDLVVMEEINQRCPFNVLHVCDYQRSYDDFSPFLDYPGHIVNCPLALGDRKLTPGEAAQMFNRPYMGGLERTGVLATGTPAQVRQAAESVLRTAPDRFILAADCTVPAETSWDNLKTAIDTAHATRRDAK
jgi:uroporphyrinogen decarboxylase